MTTQRKITIWVLIALAIGLYLIFGRQNLKAQAKTDKEIYLEKWTSIGEYKYQEQDYNKKAEEAKLSKDKLLEELNGTWLVKIQ